MAFLTILAAPRLTAAGRRRAARAGPPAVLARDHHALLWAAGFGDIEETDVTAAYLESVRAWFHESVAREEGLRAVLGDQFLEDRLEDRLAQAAAIEEGLLRRSLFVCRRR